MYRSGWVNLFSPVVHGFVVLTVECLIPKTPRNDAWMVFVTMNHLFHSLNIGGLPRLIVSGKFGRLRESQLLAVFVWLALWNFQGPGDSIIETMAFYSKND